MKNPISAEIQTFYEKSMTVSIHAEIMKRLDKIAVKLADEVMSKYEVKNTFLKSANKLGLDKDKLIITTILEPKK